MDINLSLPPIKALTIQVRYSCTMCGLFNIPVAVKIRTEEPVVEWIDQVMIPALGADHFQRSPLCKPSRLTDIKIPITGASMVGGPAEN